MLAEKTRRITKELSERPDMRIRMLKLAVKGVIGLAFSAVIGYVVKMEHRIDDKIDEHYDKKSQGQGN